MIPLCYDLHGTRMPFYFNASQRHLKDISDIYENYSDNTMASLCYDSGIVQKARFLLSIYRGRECLLYIFLSFHSINCSIFDSPKAVDNSVCN